jgi:hypothetical protein
MESMMLPHPNKEEPAVFQQTGLQLPLRVRLFMTLLYRKHQPTMEKKDHNAL